MTLWLAIIALVLVVNEWIAPIAIIVVTHVDDNEQRADIEQAGPASVLDFLVRPPRSNPLRTCEPATKTPSEVLLTCNSALRAPKSERAYACCDADGRRPITVDRSADRSPTTDARNLTLSP